MLKRTLRLALWLVLCGLAVLAAVALLSHRTLPPHAITPTTHAADTANTGLGVAVARETAGHEGLTGIYPLYDGRDAFAARTVLANAAERTIDAQYYIWHNDMAGHLLFQSLVKAADRGVRVRLLLDDNNTQGLDALLQSLDAHPNIEVRLFNPFMQREQRLLGYLSDFGRLNRRMHNKSFTVDNQIAVVGGRNVGDEYYATGQGVMFADLDVATIGPAVQDISRQFDRYWNSTAVYPAHAILPATGPAATAESAPPDNDATHSYLQAVAGSTLMQQLAAGRLPLHWAPVRLIHDDPAKGLGNAPAGSNVLDQLTPVITAASKDLTIVSPYFVPTQAGTDVLAGLARKQVPVTILTNSLSATDVPAVHAGYARYRPALLSAGVRLFELKRGAAVVETPRTTPPGSSDASLHAKTFAVDGQRVFVGSFNMDPRSAALNTEMGLLIESPELARMLSEALARKNPVYAFAVTLDQGQLRWQSQESGNTYVLDAEPETSWKKRMLSRLLALLPIEWLL